MTAFEVTYEDLTGCAQQGTECAQRLAVAAGMVDGLAPDTGRADSATMAANAARALHADVVGAREALDGLVERLVASAQTYRAADDGVATRLAGADAR